MNIRTGAWTPPLHENISPETVIEKIKRYVLFPSRVQKSINLSLSGGLDSRGILALLLSGPGVSFQSRIWTSIKSKVGMSYQSGAQVSLLHLLKEFILDTLSSELFLSYPHYNHRNIRHKVDTFFREMSDSPVNSIGGLVSN
jgi:hypothetical protein